MTRREFVAATLVSPVAAFARQASSDARLIGTVPLGNPGGFTTPPFGRLLGSGLDARLFTDLSVLAAEQPQTLVTPTDRFFVRTACPAAIERTDGWTISVGGLVRSSADVDFTTLTPLVARGGRYLIECSGNVDQSNYGLMSAADWDGVPFGALLDRIGPAAGSHRVLVSGVDDERSAAGTSVAGASWIFGRSDLEHAILATRMNGAPLPRDHGFPVRLIVPGWYGCACIKWVNRVEIVPDEAPATTQMREFAARTHQKGTPVLARDFAPAVIDTAAMPVRVEKWSGGGRIFYRVAGIVWGGSKPTNALSIRFKSGDVWTGVDDCPLPASTLTWSLWSHVWRPAAPGRYQIVLRVDDPAIRTRRLDIFFYVRDVQIDEV
jgi:DMSO/TMAO reductase YedYZ molybdopterin-dependent catalytic subunit